MKKIGRRLRHERWANRGRTRVFASLYWRLRWWRRAWVGVDLTWYRASVWAARQRVKCRPCLPRGNDLSAVRDRAGATVPYLEYVPTLGYNYINPVPQDWLADSGCSMFSDHIKCTCSCRELDRCASVPDALAIEASSRAHNVGTRYASSAFNGSVLTASFTIYVVSSPLKRRDIPLK